MRSLDQLTLLLSDGGVLAVGKWTGLPRTQPCEVVLITTEVLTLRPGVECEQRREREKQKNKRTGSEELSGLPFTSKDIMSKWSLFSCVITYLTLKEQNELLPMMSQITCRPETKTVRYKTTII